jgi:hypothetical protein
MDAVGMPLERLPVRVDEVRLRATRANVSWD